MPYYYHLRNQIRENETRNKVIDKLLHLRTRLDKSIPSKDADSHLLLATWNIRDFDKSNRRGYGKRLPESLFYIAEIISRFDIVAVQEVNRLDELRKVMKILGPDWDYIATDVTDPALGGNGERMTFVFDKRKVWFKHIAGEIVLPTSMLISKVSLRGKELEKLLEEQGSKAKRITAGKQFRRTPFVVSFQAGWFKFDICTVHIYYGNASGEKLKERVQEINAIAKYLSDRADIGLRKDNALILLGDFNIVSPEHKTMQALTKYKFKVPEVLKNFKTNVAETKHYDQIAFKTKKNVIEFVNTTSDDPLKRNAGVFDLFKSAYKTGQIDDYLDDINRNETTINGKKYKGNITKYYKDWRTYQLSDHKPVWVRLKVNESEDYLKSLKQE